MKAVFFVKTAKPEILQRCEFYAVDIRILQELGYEIIPVTSAFHIPKADLYVVWWWTWAFLPLLRARLYNRPIIVLGTFDHVMADGSVEMFPRRPRWHQYLIRLVLKYADANVVCSLDQKDYLNAHFHVKGLEYSPHVIDVEQYKPGAAPREKYFLTFCWMKAGNARRKCMAEIIKAMAMLHQSYPEYRLIIAGEKNDGFPGLMQLVHALNASDYIEFPGVVSKEIKIELMQKCAAYIQPSRGEGFGVAILEAMSCGAPVITSPVGAVSEVVGDTAMLVDGNAIKTIADAMETLLKNPSLARDYGLHARQRAVALFSYERRRNDIHRILNKNFPTLI
jgi:glycosyltransferase involved in cell wall biosynthesis